MVKEFIRADYCTGRALQSASVQFTTVFSADWNRWAKIASQFTTLFFWPGKAVLGNQELVANAVHNFILSPQR